MKLTHPDNCQPTSITQRDVWRARKRIAAFVQKSPLIYSEALSNEFQTDVYLKMEQLQLSASFKIRGAANKILSLSDAKKEKGITTFSTGNFGRSVAYVAKQLGINARICISGRVPDAKVNALEETGATVVQVGVSQDDAEEHCYQLEKKDGLTVIHPFDDPDVIAGQGTIGLEILDELPDVDTVIAGLSGGGLHSGLGVALKSATTNTLDLIGVSTEQGAAMYESIVAYQPVQITESDTLADSLLGGIGVNNKYTFQLVQHYVDHLILVNEQEIAAGMRHMLGQERIVAEGAAAAGIGAAIYRKIPLGKKTVFVITGSGVDMETLEKVIKD